MSRAEARIGPSHATGVSIMSNEFSAESGIETGRNDRAGTSRGGSSAFPAGTGQSGAAMTGGFGSGSVAPSAWVERFAPLLGAEGEVLDFACGGGRHARWLAERGFRVEAVDRDAGALASLATSPGVQVREADLENGPWPYRGRQFDAVVVTNYLFRPRLAELLDCVVPGGVLIYETFMLGNERFGKPSNPDFLLRPGELLDRLHGGYLIVAFEQGEVALPRPAVVQRVCAVRHPSAMPCLPMGPKSRG